MKPLVDEKLPPTLPALWRTIRIGYDAEPRLLVVSFAMTVFTALPDVLIALWLALLADGVTEGDDRKVSLAVVGVAVSATLTWFLGVVFQRVERRFRDKVSIALESHVARLQASISTIEHHERPEYLDRLSVLRNQVFALDHLFLSLFSMAGWIVRLLITLVLLVTIHPALVLLGLFGIPMVLVALKRPPVENAAYESVAPHDRLTKHYFELGTTAAPGKEVRLSGLESTLLDERAEQWGEFYRPVSRAHVVTSLWNAAAWALFGLAYVGAIVFVVSGLDASTGSAVLILVVGGRLSQYVGAAIGELVFMRGIWVDSARRLAWLEWLAKTVDENADLQAPERLEQGIHFDHVTFRYPGTDQVVLDDVSLDLPAGSVVAIVGENGAGKTTLVKLLARLYPPDSGTIEADGIDIGRMPSEEWRSRLAGAFQDFFRFELSALHSVGLGDEPHMDEQPVVAGAVDRAGADDLIDRLARGLDTQLGPTWDEGVEVSFGQWQKLALARGFMRPDPLVLVLDEPTSALDAETEHALFERYAESSRQRAGTGAVTLLVSHRFSTVRMADLIIVLDGSQVAETGSHDELMARDGLYADLYRIQADSYQ